MVVDSWLSPCPRPSHSFSFSVIDVEETSSIPTDEQLAPVLQEAYWGISYLSRVAERYGQEAVREKFLASRTNTKLRVRRGDFGEAISAEYLKSVEGYQIPVSKLKFKIGANQTLPGTDCIALKLSNGELEEVAFVESKFRASPDTNVAVEGALQLKEDADNKIPEVLPFIARILRERDDPLTDLFESYMFGRDLGLESYLLMILYERAIWSEVILVNLEDENVELDPFQVYVCKINELKELADSTFSKLDLEVIGDD